MNTAFVYIFGGIECYPFGVQRICNFLMILFRCGISRVTSEKTKRVEEYTYLDIVDMDESFANKIVTRTLPDTKVFLKCPHHIVEKVIKIVSEQVRRKKYQEEPKALQKVTDNFKILNAQQDKMINMMNEMKEKIDKLENSNVHKF